jgi:hypothetical protein
MNVTRYDQADPSTNTSNSEQKRKSGLNVHLARSWPSTIKNDDDVRSGFSSIEEASKADRIESQNSI